MPYRWRPFREMYDLQKVLNSLFEDIDWEKTVYRGKYPLIDIVDNGDDYEIRAEMPGVCKDDAKVTVKGNAVTIEGNRKCLDLPEEAITLRSERGVGTFRRSFELPEPIDAENVKATFKNGILYIALPKKEKEKPRHIEVKVGE